MKYLIVVDMQNDFVDGSLGTPEAVSILPAVRKKITEYDGTVLFTRDTHPDSYLETQEGRNLPVRHCIKGSPGWEIVPQLSDLMIPGQTPVFDKPTFGSVSLGEYLLQESRDHSIDEIELCGLCTDICVISNAMLIKAFLPEVPISVDPACCAGTTPENHRNALQAMSICQIKIRSSEK